MVLQVSDSASNRRDQIANFVELIASAPSRKKILSAVYSGKKSFKTVGELAEATKFSTKRVTEIAKPLARQHLFDQDRERVDGRMQTIYRKNPFVAANKAKIVTLAGSKKKFAKYHTKTNPKHGSGGSTVVIKVPFRISTKFISIDDVDQFSRVKKFRKVPATLTPGRLPEKTVKRGLLRLLGDPQNPKDWPGETNDILTLKLKIKGRTRRSAFALKGPGVKGPLVPRMMGKNGDQIQRLFASPAEVFFVQYEDEIKQSVISLMEDLARARATLGGDVLFGVIDKDATYRLRLAYPKAFST
jgi:hypothetical protein